jgi:hypothetical protein
VFEGPLHYCGSSFAIELAAGEKVEFQQGPDFAVESLISERGGFGIYEGNFPQNGTDGEVVEVGLGKVVKRLPRDQYGISYLVETGLQFPAYVHTWGDAFKGTPADLPLLRRLDFAPPAKRHCSGPSYARNS